MFGMISEWRKHLESHEECKVLLSMLTTERSEVKNVKLFLKVRKAILKTMSSQIMEEIKFTQGRFEGIKRTSLLSPIPFSLLR